MERENFVSDFTQRLNSILIKEGYSSGRSKVGINANELAIVAGVSYQMARKYILGLALPECHVVSKIARWLKVSPGWLLFGESEQVNSEQKSATVIEIETDILKYILYKCAVLFPETTNADKIINYIVGMIYDASHLNADKNTIIKIIDMMISSAMQLNHIRVTKELNYG